MVEVRRVAADANLDVAGLDHAVEQFGGHALGELDVHVYLLQRLVPLEHLLPVVDEGVALLRCQLLCHGHGATAMPGSSPARESELRGRGSPSSWRGRGPRVEGRGRQGGRVGRRGRGEGVGFDGGGVLGLWG